MYKGMQMSYLRKIEYEIVPKECFKVIRNCGGCGSVKGEIYE